MSPLLLTGGVPPGNGFAPSNATPVDDLSLNSEDNVTVYIAVPVVLGSLTLFGILFGAIIIYFKCTKESPEQLQTDSERYN